MIKLKCPLCGKVTRPKTLDCRARKNVNYIRRRKQCPNCGKNYSTIETVINQNLTNLDEFVLLPKRTIDQLREAIMNLEPEEKK